MNQTMTDYLKSMERAGRGSTAECYSLGLVNYSSWLDKTGVDPLGASLLELEQFQRWLAQDYRSPKGKALGRGTQGTRLASVKAYYAWMYARGVIHMDPAQKLRLPIVRRRTVTFAHLTQQETTALLQTQAKRVSQRKQGSRLWAIDLRNLAMLCLALASGRRRMTFLALRVEHMDFTRNEIRIEWEKGKPGRVLPCAAWAMKAVRDYVQHARPVLLGSRDDQGWLFVGNRIPRVTKCHLRDLLQTVHKLTVAENPDLEELAAKKLTTHSLRVSFAMLMFMNGANIRTVNELLLHSKLSTTAKYTPLKLEDLRRACRLAHPRA